VPAENQPGAPADDLRVLELALDDLRRENERLRTARASVTKQLGPLPISAAAIAGLITVFPGGHAGSQTQRILIYVALGVFGLMVFVSIRYSALKPYRKLRDELEKELPEPKRPGRIAEARADPDNPKAALPGGDQRSMEVRWYAAMIDVEKAVRGDTTMRPTTARGVWLLRLPWPPQAENLQDGFDLEWRGLFLVQCLFAVVVALLIIARLN
jgi:hypothetical protein